MQKPVTYVLLLALSALLSSTAAGQSSSPAVAAAGGDAVSEIKPKPWGTEPGEFVFSIERGVDGSASQTKESEQKQVGDVIHEIMKEHEYKDFETFKIDAQSPTKNLNTYYVRFFKVRHDDEP